MSTQPARIQDAPTPFSGATDPDDSIPPSDFILRCADGADLHVHKDILKFVSVFFKNMFAGASDPTAMQREGKPILELPEDSTLFYRLLCIAYPGRSLEHYSLAAQNLDGVWAVHQIANKYLFIGVQELIEKMLANPTLLKSHPHRLFAIARLRELPDLARQAALYTLKSPVCPDIMFPEMELLTATTLQRLYNFHRTCGDLIYSLLVGRTGPQYVVDDEPDVLLAHHSGDGHRFIWWSMQHSARCGAQQAQPVGGDFPKRVPTPWFRSHIVRLAPLLRISPTRETVEREACSIAPASQAAINACVVCRQNVKEDLGDFAAQLATLVEEITDDYVNRDGVLGL
ncbi:hypothetical protein C8R43DRAFT_1143180 [Mycena crocata]|nr:hypothetical protein C8R43DRAFT_1143180 [Mycena crocata]